MGSPSCIPSEDSDMSFFSELFASRANDAQLPTSKELPMTEQHANPVDESTSSTAEEPVKDEAASAPATNEKAPDSPTDKLLHQVKSGLELLGHEIGDEFDALVALFKKHG